jgi:hypothetical protein
MNVRFIIDSSLFKRSMSIKANWNFPHLPRVGEQISPLVIMLNPEFDYVFFAVEFLTDEARNDLEQRFSCNEKKLKKIFKAWIYDVICESNIIESIHYVPNPEDYTEIIPEIYLGDLSY